MQQAPDSDKRLFIGNLPWEANNVNVANLFSISGLISVEVKMFTPSNCSKGFGFLEFASKEEAANAISRFSGMKFGGRPLYINHAIEVQSDRRRRHSFREFIPTHSDEDAPPLAEFLSNRPIIEVSNHVSVELMKYIKQHPDELRKMGRRRFEELVAEIWSGFGFTVELTQQTRDGGKDIIAVRNDLVAERFLIECKRPEPGNCVGIEPVRALYGVQTDERATKAILATTTHFSKDAIIFIEAHRWQLEGKDFYGLMEWVNEYIRRKS